MFDPALASIQRFLSGGGREREAASRRLMTEGGVGWGGWQEGGRGKTGSSSPPQIKGADLDVHQRTQTVGIKAQMNRMI